jgi:hypothetical protein
MLVLAEWDHFKDHCVIEDFHQLNQPFQMRNLLDVLAWCTELHCIVIDDKTKNTLVPSFAFVDDEDK